MQKITNVRIVSSDDPQEPVLDLDHPIHLKPTNRPIKYFKYTDPEDKEE